MSCGSNIPTISILDYDIPHPSNTQYYSSVSLGNPLIFAGGIGSSLGLGYVSGSMGSEGGELEEDGEDSDKEEIFICVPGQRTTHGIAALM